MTYIYVSIYIPTILWAYSDVLGFHTRNVWSVDALTTHLPSVVNPPQVMGPSWPANTAKTSPFTPFHIQMVASSPPHNNALPLGCHSRNYHIFIPYNYGFWLRSIYLLGGPILVVHHYHSIQEGYRQIPTIIRVCHQGYSLLEITLSFDHTSNPIEYSEWFITRTSRYGVIYLHETYWLGFTGLHIT